MDNIVQVKMCSLESPLSEYYPPPRPWGFNGNINGILLKSAEQLFLVMHLSHLVFKRTRLISNLGEIVVSSS